MSISRGARIAVLFLAAPSSHALVDQLWQLSLSIGRIGATTDLPKHWNEAEAPDGRTYYYHAETRESCWTRPLQVCAISNLMVHAMLLTVGARVACAGGDPRRDTSFAWATPCNVHSRWRQGGTTELVFEDMGCDR